MAVTPAAGDRPLRDLADRLALDEDLVGAHQAVLAGVEELDIASRHRVIGVSLCHRRWSEPTRALPKSHPPA